MSYEQSWLEPSGPNSIPSLRMWSHLKILINARNNYWKSSCHAFYIKNTDNAKILKSLCQMIKSLLSDSIDLKRILCQTVKVWIKAVFESLLIS